MSGRVLTLDTLEDHPVVAIDGVDYPLMTWDDFGLTDLARTDRMQKQLTALMARVDDLSDADAEAMAGILDNLTAMVLPTLPPERRAKLRDGHKLAIVQAFQRATETRRAGTPSSPPSPPTLPS